MTTDISGQTDVDAARKEAAWARMEEVVRRASSSAETDRPDQPTPARDDRRARRRLLAVALGVSLLVLGGAALVRVEARRATPASGGAVSAAGAGAVAPLASATSGALAAIASERASLAALSGIPTPASVAPVADAYAASLLHYVRAVEGDAVPAGARPLAAAAARDAGAIATQVHGVRLLPPILLGAFLTDLAARSAQLEHTLRQLDAALHAFRTP